MTKPLNFQEIILRLHDYWAERGCLIWQPHNVQVGAGTMNPATILRVLGPEPWNVGYVEPSVRPDDSRYGENPNRVQQHIQYQVILKPDPGNPQDLYLGSLAAIGIDQAKHDIRFVEDNWESPALGAWGLGWEVWLDGLEITQFTYFQQAGGTVLDPVAVELTYGLERIAMFLQGVDHFKQIQYAPGLTYGDMYGIAEYEHSRYNLDDADIEDQVKMYRLYESEAQRCIDLGLVLPAHDFVLKCSHTFNVLDARGAIGVTERAKFFASMRDLARQVSQAYLDQRQRLEYPLLDQTIAATPLQAPLAAGLDFPGEPRTFVLEIGTEELPPDDVIDAVTHLELTVPKLLDELRLDYGQTHIYGSPRRLAVLITELAPRQRDEQELVKGPPAKIAFDENGMPTKAALGFARGRGLEMHDLETREMDGGLYAVGTVRRVGRPTGEVLSEVLAGLVAGISFKKSMRWNASGVAFSRPVRWLLALLGDQTVPFTYAYVLSGRVTRGLRPDGSPEIEITTAERYADALAQANVLLDQGARRAAIVQQIEQLATDVGGQVPDDPGLLQEVTYLVEQPTALLGRFEEKYLNLPRELLVMVMRKHQRYFPVMQRTASAEKQESGATTLLPYFIAIRNGGDNQMDIVRHGNQEVIRARFADAEFFWKADTQKKLEEFLPRLNTLTFQEQLGSMLDKARRLETLVPQLCVALQLSEQEAQIATRAARLCKADLVTQMVTDFTALQGVMGREYALRSGEPKEVAQTIFEHYLPRSASDAPSATRPGLALGLANRLDSLAGLFAVGLAPSGSADPYHLRRDALGIVHNLIAHRQPFSVRQGLRLAAGLMPVDVSNASLDETVAFVRERLRGVLRDEGFAFDVVDAVLSGKWADDPFRARVAVEQLAEWIERDDWPQILAAFSRCVRILRTLPEGLELTGVDAERFVEPATQELYEVYEKAVSRLPDDREINDLFNSFLPLVAPITAFFDKVLVMEKDEGLRNNRLALLTGIASLTGRKLDLSRLQGF